MKWLPGKVNPALLKTFLLYLVLSLVLFLLPVGFLRPVRDVVLYPFGLAQRVLLAVVRTAASAGRLEHLWRADREAERLRAEVRALEAELAAERTRRSAAEARLAQVARVPAPLAARSLPAEVIAFDPAPLRRVALLNRGERAGVAPRALVLFDGVVIGRIESVGPLASRAALIGDPACRVAVRNLRTRVSGVLQGAGTGRCIVKYVDLTADVRPGDRFVTSELDAGIPAGLPAAECIKVEDIPGEIFQHVQAMPLFRLRELNDVIVLLPPLEAELTDSGHSAQATEGGRP